ncbi:MAG TPA: hypothetical protein VK465_08470 [Fibrobacteria bacterium]|nr:hypothetical protein [Fibrobacteria bacterium]
MAYITRSGFALASALAIALSSPSDAATVRLTFSDTFNGGTRLPLADTKIIVVDMLGRQVLSTSFSDAAGYITPPTIRLAEQQVVIIPVPNSDAVDFNPDRGCLSGLINRVIGNNTHF